ncbi:hypothetical protein LTR50_003587 [Elasticomyces elasticus]|nr:hypothetical protein LTR50_003587 [Elasticomyces elasticus]
MAEHKTEKPQITSRFDGVIKKLHYQPDDMAIVGKPLVDIDIQSEISPEDEALTRSPAEGDGQESNQPEAKPETSESTDRPQESAVEGPLGKKRKQDPTQESQPMLADATLSTPGGRSATLATPAVRHLSKELNIDIAHVKGTGKDGRVMKEDLHNHAAKDMSSRPSAPSRRQESDRKLSLTPVQQQMFKVMTRSLSIPHFLYTSTVDLTPLTALRARLNASTTTEQRLTHLPFILKAVSLAFQAHPLLNVSLDTTDPSKPQLTEHASHNIGVAIDTPSGLLVPVVHNVQDLTIVEIAAKLAQLSTAARSKKLTPSAFAGATFSISNIGSIGGGVVAPVISEPQVAILGVGRSRIVPAFDEEGRIVKREECVLSWSADHRIVDGAECARCAEKVRGFLEEIGEMAVLMR